MRPVTVPAFHPSARTRPALPGGEVLARGTAADLSADAAAAWVDAFAFALATLALPARFTPELRAMLVQRLARTFPELPEELQLELATLRHRFARLRSDWALLPPRTRRDLLFTVLTVAWGEAEAARALGPPPGRA